MRVSVIVLCPMDKLRDIQRRHEARQARAIFIAAFFAVAALVGVLWVI